jgi:hypothetical protein
MNEEFEQDELLDVVALVKNFLTNYKLGRIQCR